MTITTTDRLVMLWRGLTRRCPRCESGALFRRWTEMVKRCPRCDLRFEREEGYWLGAIILNTSMTGLVLALLILLAVVLTWPQIPALWFVAVGLPIAFALPFALYPVSKTLWVAIDCNLFHPIRPWRRRKPETEE